MRVCEMKEAMFYEKEEGNKVKCTLCPHGCVILPEKRGICGVRENQEGRLFSLVYGKAISLAIDPIEKKPLYHFYPGSSILSFATIGCNMKCLNCQNYSISQIAPGESIEGRAILPGEIVKLAKERNCKSIACTYTEPTIFYEYAYETARLASKEGIKNVFVTNGYINPEPLKAIKSWLDAANVDLKSFREETYLKTCKAKLEPVLKTIELMKELGIWVEVTTLIIPGVNDSEEELEEIANFISSLGKDIPWHLSRFYPAYRLTDRPQTPLKTLHQARDIGKKVGLRYVYTGNVPGDEGENTYCWSCGKLIIERYGFSLLSYRIKDSSCEFCGAKIDGMGL